MAKAAGVAASTVQAIWKAHGLSPHRWRNFKLSNDPAFAETRSRQPDCELDEEQQLALWEATRQRSPLENRLSGSPQDTTVLIPT